MESRQALEALLQLTQLLEEGLLIFFQLEIDPVEGAFDLFRVAQQLLFGFEAFYFVFLQVDVEQFVEQEFIVIGFFIGIVRRAVISRRSFCRRAYCEKRFP